VVSYRRVRLLGSPKRKLREYASIYRKLIRIPSAHASGFPARTVVLPLPSRRGLGRQSPNREHFVRSQWLDIRPRHGDHGDRITESVEDFKNATLSTSAWVRNEFNDVGDVTGTQLQFLEIPAQCHAIMQCHSHQFFLRRGLSVTK
jgi:hypothetical protein